MQYLPIHFDTRGASILIVGGGAAAEAKLRTLLKTEANLLVVAVEVSPEIERWVSQGKLQHFARDFETTDLDSVSLIYAATEDDTYNCLLYTSPIPRDLSTSRMPSSA